ncbi:MAG: protein kinase [Acidobacteria bacterium]|nr:protein kinase [Acidobacteriota bacterium]
MSSGRARWAAICGDYLAAGDLYRLAGNPRRALRMYRKARAFRLAGEIADQMGDHTSASREYERGGLVLPAAESALKAGDRERAARLFVEGGQARRAAEIHEQGGRPAAAAALFEHAGDPLRATRLFLEARQPDRASRTLDELFRAGPTPAEMRELLGLAARCGQQLLASGQPELAARWLERSGRSHEAAQAWERAGRPDRAIRAFLAAGEAQQSARVAEALEPGALDSGLAAEAFRAAGRWAEAAALFLESGRPAEAAACLEQLGCPAEAAWAHEAAGDLHAAAVSCERAADHGAAADLYLKAGALHDAARCLEACGRLEEAARAFLEAGDRLAAAEVFERLAQLDAAVDVLQALPRDSDQVFAAALVLGRLFERKGADALAAEQYRRALSGDLSPDRTIEAWYQLAGTLERTGKLREAIGALRKVLSLDYHYRDAARRLAALERRAATATPTGPQAALPSRYRIERPLPGPGPGQSVLAWDSGMDRNVLLRRFSPEVVPPGPAADRLLSDVRRIAQLHHPAIAAIHDAGQDEGGVFVVEDYVAGDTVREALEAGGPLDVPRAVHVLTRLAEALDYAHGLGLLARTLRPETIVLTPAGDVRVLDFGLALRHSDGNAPANAYRPPEVRRGERMDPSTDVYLLGVLTWEMLFGSPPPIPAPSQTEAPEVPDSGERTVPDLLRRVLAGCLAPDRARRIPSAQKLLEELHGTNLLPGALLANRYEILRELGRGGMGTVFAARDLVLDEPVALKVLAGPLDENTEKRFIQEIRLARQINHPNIVRVHTFERWRELRFIVMEYIDGVDLRRWAENRRPIPLGRALEIVAGVAAGLAAAHRLGIVHRDVKPENVLLDPDGRPRLVDFGIARQGDVHLTREGLVMGSPAYMAPEQIRGEASDQRADLYALGILAYFLVVGREPFASDNVAEVLRQQIEEPAPTLSSRRNGVPASIDDLFARVLAKDPNRRPSSVFAFLEELSGVRAQLTVITA